MDLLLEKLWDFVARDKSLTLQERLFRLMTLTAAIVCLFIVLPVNLMEPSLPLGVNIADIILGLFSLFCYTQSCKGKNHIKLFLVVLVSLLSPVWFLNGGVGASITFYFFPVIVLPLVLCRGALRWGVAAFVVFDLIALVTLEYFYPNLVTYIPNRADYYWDNITGIVCSFIALALVVWVIVTNYDWEQGLLSRYAKELAASEENYRSVVENAMSIILRLDVEGRVTFFNRFAENLFGYSRGEIIGQNALGTIVPTVSSKGESLVEKFEALLKHPEQHALSENENLCRDGRRIQVTWTNRPIYDEQGSLREILCVGADVTQQVLLLEQLRMTQLTMDAAAEQILWTDDLGKIIYANAAATEGLGYSAEALRVFTLHDLATDFPAEDWTQLWQQLRRERSATLELTQCRSDQATRPVELSITYFKVANKEYSAVFIRDLTERKKTEEKRRQHELEMQHLQRLESLGVLAGGIAHDFNNLLTAILANVSLVKMDLPVTSENHELLNEAEKASLQARGLTGQLLTFSKGGKPVKSAVNLEQIIRDSTSFALRGKPVKCIIEIPAALRSVEADAAQLTQVFNNLVLNAYQAMPNGGQITIRAQNRNGREQEQLLVTEGEYVEVSIQDEGTGIAPEHLPKIFDPYFTTKKSGTGLGLAVVHSIISNHHGAIFVDSRPGAGTTFTLLLPVSEKTPAAKTQVAMTPAAQNQRIMIMDDEAMVCRVLSKMLRKLGYEAETVSDGQAALQKYEQAVALKKPFDLLIMDLTIPGGMGGKEAIERLHKLNPNVKAIVSSGYSNDPILSDFSAYGFKGVILKPYTHDQVQAAVRKVLTE